MRLATLTLAEARTLLAADITLVLPTGSCEQHGLHLPLDTDIFLAEQVALAACTDPAARAAVLPPLNYGYNEKELNFPGTVSLTARTFLDSVVDLGRGLRRGGWRRLMIVNGHGWNNDLVRVATHMLNEEPGFTAACCSYWAFCSDAVDALRESPMPGGMAHACEFETSLMLHLRPESVRLDRITDEISYRHGVHYHHDLFHKSPIALPEPFDHLSESGVIGTPSLATAKKGAVWFDAAVAGLRAFLIDYGMQYSSLADPGAKN